MVIWFTRTVMRERLVIGNFKMYWKSGAEADHSIDALSEIFGQEAAIPKLVVCPPAVFLDRCRARLPESIALGGQDMFWEESGAYTGEESAGLLAAVGAGYVIVGHSERRQWLGETDEMVGKKVSAAIRGGLRPILCVGETQEEREAGKAEEQVRKQLISGAADTGIASGMVVAYEPRWAIGSDVTPTPEDISAMSRTVRSVLAERFGESADDIPVLYGGSVDPDNIRSLTIESGMDGALVGRASLDPEALLAMYRRIQE